jgi:hypothetical protein
VNLKGGQQRLGRLDQAVKIVPPAVTSQLLFQIAPEALDQIELGRVGRQKAGLQAVGVASPDRAQRVALVLADVVEDQHGWFVGGQRLGEVLEEGAKGGFPFARARLPEHLTTGVVHRAEHHRLLVLAGCRDL